MARRRYQRGSLFLRGKKHQVWVGRWREDVIGADAKLRRPYRSKVLGSIADFPTRKLALRELERQLAPINDPRYRARPSCSFEEFTERWQNTVLKQYKISTQHTIRSELGRHILPFFGPYLLRDLQPELVQRFVSQVQAGPKSVRNLAATLRMMVRTARAWGYFTHDPLEGVVLPRAPKPVRRSFSLEELQSVLAAAQEPERTFYAVAAETGLRAGELCGLRGEDLDLERGLLFVRQSAWRGRLQDPKTEGSIRKFALSVRLVEALQAHLQRARPNPHHLLFVTRTGKPWDAGAVVKRRLHPLLERLGIPRGGLHGFRHANSSLMDRLNTPVKVRQQRLGHSDPRTTLGTYTHVASEDDRRVAEQLGAILHRDAPKLEESGIAIGEQSPFVSVG